MIRPQGLLESPFTPSRMGRRLRLEDVQWTDAQTLVWLEGRTDRGALMSQSGTEAPHDLDAEASVRAGVGYGGGDFTTSRDGVYYVPRGGAVTRRAWKETRARALHPTFGGSASPTVSFDGRWVLFIHTFNGTDLLAVVDSRGARWPVDLARGADFYMQPAWHPSGRRIAWVEWNHPQMPWDGARLCTAQFDPIQPALHDLKTISGGTDVPVFQPIFSPDGRYLAWLEGDGEEDTLVALDLDHGERQVMLRETGLLPPAWVQGMRALAWYPDSQSLLAIRNRQGIQSLVRVFLDGSLQEIDGGPYTAFSQVSLSEEGTIAVIASSPSIPDRIVRQESDRWAVVRRSDPEDIPEEELPKAVPVSWTSSDEAQVFGLYFPPMAPTNVQPPLLVNVHGGPTAQRIANWSADTAFFTTRGWAVLEVNHRGSSGYGRSYQKALQGRWGELDAQDVAEGALAMAERGFCDPTRMVVKGGSAGGFTVLRLLTTRPDLFRAGVSLYGVSDLLSLAEGTHKFEERYLDGLLGPLPQSTELYRERSPLRHVQAIRTPLALFQGSEDRVVPPDQSERIAQALSGNGIPHLYRLYPGEGHGWRKSDTINAYYMEVDRFLRSHVILS